MGIVRTQISATSINAHFAGIDHILVPFMIAGMNPLDSAKNLLDLGKNCSNDWQNFHFCDRNDGLKHIVQVSLFMLFLISQIKELSRIY